MAGWVTVGSAGEVGEGAVKAYKAEEREIAVANVGGTLHAFDDICTHRNCNLSSSELEGTEIECECHGSRFDVTSGEVRQGPATEPVDVFEAREQDGDLQISLG